MLIVIAILALLFTPATIRSVLERAGIRSVAGVEFDVTTLAESQTELAAAQAQINELQTQLSMAETRFTQAVASSGNSRNQSFTAVSDMLSQMHRQADSANDRIHRSRMKQERLAETYSAATELPPANTQSIAPSTANNTLVAPEVLFNR
jgi:chromosome segregation ATPase